MRQRQNDFTQINITPLTDIFLVLVIIMMVIAPMLDSKGISLAVPTVSPDENLEDEPKVITLHVDTAGMFSIDEQPVPGEMLQKTIYDMKGDNPDGLVIETEPDALHGSLVQAMDAARAAGVEKMAVVQAGGNEEAEAEATQ